MAILRAIRSTLESGKQVVQELFASGNALHVSVRSSLVPTDAERNVKVNGALGSGDNTVIYTSPANMLDYSTFIFRQTETGGSVSMQVKLNEDDTVWSSDIAVQDLTATSPGTARVLVTAAGNTAVHALLGRFYQVRVLQNGATASNVVGQHCNSVGV